MLAVGSHAVAQLLKAPKVTQAGLAGFLAIVKSNYEAFGRVPDEYQGACNVPIPVEEVIALIGKKLVGKARWSVRRGVTRGRRPQGSSTSSGRRRPMSFGGRQ